MFDKKFDYDAIAKNATERYSSETYYEKLMDTIRIDKEKG